MTKDDYQELTRLLELTWRKRSGSIDAKMVRHCLESGKYIKIDDRFVCVCELKPSITKTIWYDDETEGPEANYQNFLHENERNYPGHWELMHRYEDPLYIRVRFWNDKTDGRIATLEYIPKHHNENAELIRPVTPEDLEKINAAVEEVRQHYKKRLETYWKKYSNQVSSRGYWVNR